MPPHPTKPPAKTHCRIGVPGGCPLTVEELRVVALLGEGLSYKEIATRTHRRVTTIRTHVHSAIGRLGVLSGAQVVVVAYQAGWIHSDVRAIEVDDLGLIRDLLYEIVAAIRQRRSYQQFSTEQRAFMRPLDVMIRARTEEEREAARVDLHAALEVWLGAPGPSREHRDLVGLLASGAARAA